MRLYGTRARALLGLRSRVADLGRHFGADLYEGEVRYLMEHEWARTAEDVLWRRTKLGLQLHAAKRRPSLADTWTASGKVPRQRGRMQSASRGRSA